MKARGLRVLLVLSLVLSAFVASLAPAGAQNGNGDLIPVPGEPFIDLIEALSELGTDVYFPWVPNGQMLGDSGPYYGDVTVQNLGGLFAGPADLYFYVGVGQNNKAYENPYVVANVQEGASVTVSAEDLEIDEPGSSVHVVGVFPEVQEFIALLEDAITELEDEIDALQDQIDAISPPADSDEEGQIEDLEDQIAGLEEDILEAQLLIALFSSLNPILAGSVKNVADFPANNAQTQAAHETVDGYTGMNRSQVAPPLTDQHILPIVQTNNGWNTELRIASFADENDPNASTAYTVTLYEAGGQGAAGTSSGEFTGVIRGGEVKHIDIMDAPGIDEGWVGNAFITSNAPIGVVAERYKNENDMLLSNVSRPVEQVNVNDPNGGPADNHKAIAPLVFQNYNYWNTGISIANTSDAPNTVTVSYFTPGGSQVGSEQLTIPPRGMEYIFTPGQQDLGLFSGFVGAATITGTGSLHAAVDQVKYFGGDPDVGDAMSYVTEPPMPTLGDFLDELGEGFLDDLNGMLNGSPFSMNEILSIDAGALVVPLIQKGNPNTGTGDTSGIQIFNSLASIPARVEVDFYDPTGNLVAPTLNQPLLFNLSGHQGVTLYTHNYSEMPAGFQGSAVILYEGAVTAVSNNVNYAVEYDGAAAYNAYRVSLFEILSIIIGALEENNGEGGQIPD